MVEGSIWNVHILLFWPLVWGVSPSSNYNVKLVMGALRVRLTPIWIRQDVL